MRNPALSRGGSLKQHRPRARAHLCGGRVHEVEGEQVVDAHGLELEHRGGQVGALDLGHWGGEHFIPVRTLRVEPVRLARPRATGTPRPLLGLGLWLGGLGLTYLLTY